MFIYTGTVIAAGYTRQRNNTKSWVTMVLKCNEEDDLDGEQPINEVKRTQQ